MNVEMYCSNCGTVGKPESYTPGTFGMEVVLWLHRVSIAFPDLISARRP